MQNNLARNIDISLDRKKNYNNVSLNICQRSENRSMVIDRYVPLADIIFNKLKISDFIIFFFLVWYCKKSKKQNKISGKEIQEIQI
jgi:hypothetical protein